MDVLTEWLRELVPQLPATDAELAEALTLRGIAVEGVFPVDHGGARFEMDITTNRVDAMNHFGIAREAAAIYELALPPLEASVAVPVLTDVEANPFPVRIEATDLCGRFTARVVRGVTVKAATGLIAGRFAALGQKSISGPVDATNYGWLLMGQPTHVFDLDTIEGGVVVRRAQEGEPLRLLDGSERTLTADDLVIADEHKALSLAGVMGGWDSRVTETTKNILVEAAWFDPAAIRRSSRRHGLHTDASHRFERGADFNGSPTANHVVTRLVLDQAGGEAIGPLTDVIIPEWQAKTAGRTPIVLRVPEAQRILGTTFEDAVWTMDDGMQVERTSGLSENVVEQYLTALGCTLVPTGGAPGEYGVTLPSWRLDLEREIDLIEEIARVYGYNRFANTLPGWSGEVHPQPHAEGERAIRTVLRALGYSEAVSNTFNSAEDAALFAEPGAGVVAMGNPLSEEAGMLRPSLVSNMAGMLAKNLARDVARAHLFELGTVFSGSATQVNERTSLVLGATGDHAASSLHSADDSAFFAMKGTLERLLEYWPGELGFDPEALPAWIAPGRGARALLNGVAVAVWGELHPRETSRRKLKQTCVLAEVRADVLLASPLRKPLARELSRFQAAERDFSFVLPDAVRWEAVETALLRLGIPELITMHPAEIFRDSRGKAIAAGNYSLLVRTVFQSADRTLTDEELTAWSGRIVASLTALGGTQRV